MMVLLLLERCKPWVMLHANHALNPPTTHQCCVEVKCLPSFAEAKAQKCMPLCCGVFHTQHKIPAAVPSEELCGAVG